MPTVSKRILAFWAFFDVCILAAGIVSVVFALLWHSSGDVLRRLVISNLDLTAGLILGIFLLLSWVLSIGAIVQPNHVTLPLTLLNWALIVDALTATICGTIVWWATLQERKNFQEAFDNADDSIRLTLQNQLQCCGYFFNNETNIINQGFCATAQNASVCVGPITSFADQTLNDIFTAIYGFGGAVAGLFLATLCVIKKRDEIERFKRIDAKRGGRGFV